MTDLAKIAAEAEAHEGVSAARIWDERRVYINFIGYNSKFAGCRNLKVYYDIKSGWQVDGVKGLYASEFRHNARAFLESLEINPPL